MAAELASFTTDGVVFCQFLTNYGTLRDFAFVIWKPENYRDLNTSPVSFQ